MNNSPENVVVQPWYREFWAWFILAPLILVVAVSSVTVSIAVLNQDDIVVDNYYKEGRMINNRFEQEDHARAMGLAGELRFDRVVGEIYLTLSAHEPLPPQLLLALDHPAQAEQDTEVQLTQIAPGHYRASLDRGIAGHWYIRVQPHVEAQIAEGPWRLKAEIDFAQTESVRFTLDE
jgi:hypothetical protein